MEIKTTPRTSAMSAEGRKLAKQASPDHCVRNATMETINSLSWHDFEIH